jgi:hypothetical protein
MRRLVVLGFLLLATSACSGATNTHARGPAGPPSPSSVTFTIPPDAIQVPAPAASGLPPVSTPGSLNPAVTQASIGSTICVKGWTATIRPPATYTTDLKRRQMAVLGLAGPLSAYEEDHLTPLELGGAPKDPRNLWPEKWDGPTGAHLKDRLENALHAKVCADHLPLAEAQQCISTNWIACARKEGIL